MKATKIPEKRLKLAAWTALIFSALILPQVMTIVFRGEPFCLNTGCKVVEDLVELNPLLFNLLGMAFFAACAAAAFLALKNRAFLHIFLLLCTAGLAAEGILIGYQAFVARTFCSYCLSVFGAIVVLNILLGFRQVMSGLSILAIELVLFSLLNFNVSTANIQQLTLDRGTSAITRCQAPARTMYLIFSEDCPHCKRVLSALSGCSMCEFHFNPVKKINQDLLPGTILQKDYVPEINRLALRILGIDAIPVLIVRQPDVYLLIKGDKEIIKYIQNHCFAAPQEAASLTPAEHQVPADDPFSSGGGDGLVDDEGGACSIEEECIAE